MIAMSRFFMIIVGGGLALAGSLSLTACSQRVPAESLRERASFAAWIGNWPDAQLDYSELVDRYPDHWNYQYNLGRAALNNGDLDTARRSLEIAETLRPQDREVATHLAETMYRQDDRDALFTFLKDRAESTQQSEDWLLVARYSLDLDDPDMARLAVQEALVLDISDSPEPYIAAAELAERLGDIDGALQSLKIAWTLDPENNRVHAMIRGLGEVPGPTMLDSTEMGG